MTRRADTDVLVVGAGAAGLRAAYEAGRHGARVLVTSKGPFGKSGTSTMAHFSIMAPMAPHPDDSLETFFDDMIRIGQGLAEEDLVSVVVNSINDRVRDLAGLGVKFLKDDDGGYRMFPVPGTSYPRSVAVENVGHRVLNGLNRALAPMDNVSRLPDFFATSLIVAGDRVAGARGVLLDSGEILDVRASAVILATGGNEALWRSNDCTPEAIGDGQFLALAAGADLVDLEMMQFYPSIAIWPDGIAGSLIPYELLSPDFLGGDLTDGEGNPIFRDGLPPRDQASRLCSIALREAPLTPHGGLYWDAARSPKSREERHAMLYSVARTTVKYMATAGPTNLLDDRVEVRPGAHYLIGGVRIDPSARSTLRGLYAAPTCAGNVEGANRLSGLGLACTQVFSVVAARAALGDSPVAARQVDHPGHWLPSGAGAGGASAIDVKSEIQTLMDEAVGAARSRAGLEAALERFAVLGDEVIPRLPGRAGAAFDPETLRALEVRMMAEVARATAVSALARAETRGNHSREDFPERDDQRFMAHSVVRRAGDRLAQVWVPVDKSGFVRRAA